MARTRTTPVSADEPGITPEPARGPRKSARKSSPAADAGSATPGKRARKQRTGTSRVTAAEEAACIATLKANEQIAAEGAALEPGQTHQMVRGPKGKKTPVRKRFSAL